jgi:hypothetical protein
MPLWLGKGGAKMNAPVTYPDTRALRGIFDTVAPRYQRGENGPAAYAVNGALYLSLLRCSMNDGNSPFNGKLREKRKTGSTTKLVRLGNAIGSTNETSQI